MTVYLVHFLNGDVSPADTYRSYPPGPGRCWVLVEAETRVQALERAESYRVGYEPAWRETDGPLSVASEEQWALLWHDDAQAKYGLPEVRGRLSGGGLMSFLQEHVPGAVIVEMGGFLAEPGIKRIELDGVQIGLFRRVGR